MLSQKGEVGRVLRMMHRVDFLGRYIPEFGQLTCLVQHEFFHRYTADEHTLVCIDKLDALADTRIRNSPAIGSCSKIWKIRLFFISHCYCTIPAKQCAPARIRKPAQFLLNEWRRGSNFTPEQRKSLILLVDHHITLSNIAQQRNLDDPATIVELANIVKTQQNLNALMLLTLADGQGTSAEAWSDWKESLVWQLYHATAGTWRTSNLTTNKPRSSGRACERT